jgi:hypothetical protein
MVVVQVDQARDDELAAQVEDHVHLVGDSRRELIHRADSGDPLTVDMHVPVWKDPAVRVNGDHVAVAQQD